MNRAAARDVGLLDELEAKTSKLAAKIRRRGPEYNWLLEFPEEPEPPNQKTEVETRSSMFQYVDDVPLSEPDRGLAPGPTYRGSLRSWLGKHIVEDTALLTVGTLITLALIVTGIYYIPRGEVEEVTPTTSAFGLGLSGAPPASTPAYRNTVPPRLATLPSSDVPPPRTAAELQKLAASPAPPRTIAEVQKPAASPATPAAGRSALSSGSGLPSGSAQSSGGAPTVRGRASVPPPPVAPSPVPAASMVSRSNLAISSGGFTPALEPPPAAVQPTESPAAAARALPAAPPPDPASTAAPAPDPVALATTAIEGLLARYREIFSALNLNGVEEFWPSVNAATLTKSFEQLDSQSFHFEPCRISVNGNRAEAVCQGTATFVPRVGSRRTRTEPRRWVFQLTRPNDRWLISSVVAR